MTASAGSLPGLSGHRPSKSEKVRLRRSLETDSAVGAFPWRIRFVRIPKRKPRNAAFSIQAGRRSPPHRSSCWVAAKSNLIEMCWRKVWDHNICNPAQTDEFPSAPVNMIEKRGCSLTRQRQKAEPNKRRRRCFGIVRSGVAFLLRRNGRKKKCNWRGMRVRLSRIHSERGIRLCCRNTNRRCLMPPQMNTEQIEC